MSPSASVAAKAWTVSNSHPGITPTPSPASGTATVALLVAVGAAEAERSIIDQPAYLKAQDNRIHWSRIMGSGLLRGA